MRALTTCLVALVLLGAAQAVRAEVMFDLAYVDHVEVTLPPGYLGFGNGGGCFAVLVNTGDEPITAGMIEQAGLASAAPQFSGGTSNLPSFAPIQPGVGVGSVGPLPLMQVLIDAMHPGETLMNVFPVQVLYMGMTVGGTFSGSLSFDVEFTMSGQTLKFPMQVDILRGERFNMRCLSAARAATNSGLLAAQGLTWGRLKGLYR